MDRTGADAFVYAKASGMYARSFVGQRSQKLFEIKRLQDLWSFLFDDEAPLIPEGLLALQLERRASGRMVSEFLSLLACYDKPDPVSLALVSGFEYNNVKSAAIALSLGKKELPFMNDLGSFSRLRMDKWPDIAAMTAETDVSWFDRVPQADELVAWEMRLDHQYYNTLWRAVHSVSSTDRDSVEKMIRDEIVLQNIVWAFRLRAYYGYDSETIKPMLAGIELDKKTVDLLCGPAFFVLEKPLDSWEEWSRWKYAWLLNPNEAGIPWEADPRWIQLEADKFLYHRAMKQFHTMPFTPGVLVSFYKIKQLEEQMIRVAAEGLRLGVSENQMRGFMEDSTNA